MIMDGHDSESSTTLKNISDNLLNSNTVDKQRLLFQVCSSDKMIPIYFLPLCKVWSILHQGSVGRVHEKNIT